MHHSGTMVCSNFFCWLVYNYYSICGQNGFFITRICSRVAMVLQLVSTYCQSGISTSVSESRNLLQVVCLQMTSKTATIQYKPVTSLASNNNALTHYEQSCGYDRIYPIFRACMRALVISLTSYPYTVWTQVSCQAVSPTNSLGTRLTLAWTEDSHVMGIGIASCKGSVVLLV